ncbi:hypothetical protein F4780DRAFT_792715 [Xylariomycetidae sp. FL0641]|nr:hypothetical protein F4780DRAFT_792715 [Xylariomycetidae sp. FL0641]
MRALLRTPSRQGAQPQPAAKAPPEAVVTEVKQHDNVPRDGHITPAMASPLSQSQLAVLPPPSLSGSVHVNKRSASYARRTNFMRTTSSQGATVPFVSEHYASVRLRCQRQLGAGVGASAFDTSHSGLLSWIKIERRQRLPHKGGSWDRVLIAAHYFADQVNRLNEAIESFTPDSGVAANLLYGQCLLLLELGHENSAALQTAFDLFYQLGQELSRLLRAEHALHLAPAITENVGRAFSELLNIVSGIAIGFHSAVHGAGKTSRLDIYATFGASIDQFRSRIKHCIREIWKFEFMSQGFEDAHHIDTITEWLAPQDSILAFLASNHINLASRPEQYTCSWFQKPLDRFFHYDEKILWIEGPAGSGKTTLANWAAERLQRPIGGRMISTLGFFYNASIPAQATCLSMLKTLLFQLLSMRIGDLELFHVISQAHHESKTLTTAESQEERLWTALRHSLDAINDNDDGVLTIVIDGLDEIEGLKPVAKQVYAKLQSLAEDVESLRIILFSQPLGTDLSEITEKIDLNEDVSDNVQTVIYQGLSQHPHFADRNFAEQEHIVDVLLRASDRSLLFASLAVSFLARQQTHADYAKAVEAISKYPKPNVNELVQQLLRVSRLDPTSRSVLSCLAAAKRPLSITEIGILLQSDSKPVETGQSPSAQSALRSVAPFIIAIEGLITLRHEMVKQSLLSIPDAVDVSLHLKDRHRDLLLRLLTCSNKYLRGVEEPQLSLMSPSQCEERLAAHYLLEYTVRYWVVHFKLSSLFKAQGDLHLPQEFASRFPASVSLALLESGCWRSQYLPQDATEFFTLAFRIRKALYGLENAAVLQSAISCAVLYETVLTRYAEATAWYAQVVKISKIVLGVQAELVITCCNTLLRISENLVSQEHTEIMTYREEVLLVLITSYTHQYGASSVQVLDIYESLSKLYVYIGEVEKAEKIRVKIEAIAVGADEEHHHRHTSESEHIRRMLEVELKKHGGAEEIDVIGGGLLDVYEGEVEETWTVTRVEALIGLAWELIIKHGNFHKAEEIYVELWLKLTEHCRSNIQCEWHEKRIEVMLKYASFLQTRKRKEEASAVLIACWNEYSTHQVSMFESIVLYLKEIAVCMKQVGMLSLSLTVFQRCFSWFKSTHKEETAVFKEIVEQIAVTSKEVVKKSSTTVTTTSSNESVIREVFESSFSSSEETQVTATTMELSSSLTSIYIEQARWTEATSVIKTVLKRSWASFFSEAIESVSLENSFSSENIELVLKLARCYIEQKRYDRVEFIYLRLYRVHCKSLKFDDAAVIKYRELYIEFLRTYEMHNVLISFYQELLVEYRNFYGPSHSHTIAILYALGDTCRQHHLTHGYWIQYYSEITVTLNKGTEVCHEDALRALIVVAEHYYETQRYAESRVYLNSILATFCKFGTKYKYFEDTALIQKTCERYYRVIEETKIEIQEHIKTLKEVRQACATYYGESSTVSLNVTVMLAETCCKSETYQYEAVSYYEHLLKHSKTVSSTIVKRSQSTLRSLYVQQITSHSSSTTVTKETVEKAVTMTSERYAEIRKTHSCTHESTLSVLKELVVLYRRQQNIERATTELRSVVVESILSVTSSTELIEAAGTLAAIYAEEYSSYAFELLRELKLQVIYKTVSKRCKFDVTKAGRSSFAFIASFEYHLRAGSGSTIASYIAELLAEMLFYERFTVCIQKKAKVDIVLLHAARVRDIIFRSDRGQDFDIVEGQALEYFVAKEQTIAKILPRTAVRDFVRLLLVYFSPRASPKDSAAFVASTGHAAVAELKTYLDAQKYKEALELARCTYMFLMAHEGLDDPSEIAIGFRLCLMMAGRGEYKHIAVAKEVHDGMLALSHTILGEVFDICKKNKIDLYRCPIGELNELIALLGDQKDYARLKWLLTTLWDRRQGQPWSPEVMLALGKRLVEARFQTGEVLPAIRLADDLVYNVPRHKQTLEMYALLAGICTSAAQRFQEEATTTTKAEGSSAEEKQRKAALARKYLRKALGVHEDALKLVVDPDADLDDDNYHDDQVSVVSGSLARGGGSGSVVHHQHHRPSNGFTTTGSRRTVSGAAAATVRKNGFPHHHHHHQPHANGGGDDDEAEPPQLLFPREARLAAARHHLRGARLAARRLGGGASASRKDGRAAFRQFDALTARVWREFGGGAGELGLPEDRVLAARWMVVGGEEGKGDGKEEEEDGEDGEDGFRVPAGWGIL